MSGHKPSDVESEQGNEQDSEKNTEQQTEIVKNTVQDPDGCPGNFFHPIISKLHSM